MQIAIVNKSTSLAGHTSELQAIAAALNHQLIVDMAPHWAVQASRVAFYADEKAVPSTSKVLYAFDTADQAGALGYHDETPDGKVYGRVFARTILDYGGGLMTGALSVAATFSHEALEMVGDAHCNLWAQRADGVLVALELGDPVENDAYNVVVGSAHVSLSNFVLPSWFDSNPDRLHPSYDYLMKTALPFHMTPGGYLITMQGGKVSEVFGADYPEWKKDLKLKHGGSRTRRRHKQHTQA